MDRVPTIARAAISLLFGVIPIACMTDEIMRPAAPTVKRYTRIPLAPVSFNARSGRRP
jgi:hypothetical protein